MKKIQALLFVLLFLSGSASFSQDILYKKDGSKEEVKVLRISEKEISYKKFSNPDGPDYDIRRSDVLMITYENGEHEVVSSDEPKPSQTGPKNLDFATNIFAFHLFDVIFGDIGFSYERILGQGLIGIKIPLAFGIYGSQERNNVFDFNSAFYSGFGIFFYPGGQGKARYFIGPQFRFGKGLYWDNYHQGSFDEYEFFYLKYLLDNGLVLTPVKNLSISFIGSVGIRIIPGEPGGLDKVAPTGQFAINMGLRF